MKNIKAIESAIAEMVENIDLHEASSIYEDEESGELLLEIATFNSHRAAQERTAQDAHDKLLKTAQGEFDAELWGDGDGDGYTTKIYKLTSDRDRLLRSN